MATSGVRNRPRTTISCSICARLSTEPSERAGTSSCGAGDRDFTSALPALPAANASCLGGSLVCCCFSRGQSENMTGERGEMKEGGKGGGEGYHIHGASPFVCTAPPAGSTPY